MTYYSMLKSAKRLFLKNPLKFEVGKFQDTLPGNVPLNFICNKNPPLDNKSNEPVVSAFDTCNAVPAVTVVTALIVEPEEISILVDRFDNNNLKVDINDALYNYNLTKLLAFSFIVLTVTKFPYFRANDILSMMAKIY